MTYRSTNSRLCVMLGGGPFGGTKRTKARTAGDVWVQPGHTGSGDLTGEGARAEGCERNDGTT